MELKTIIIACSIFKTELEQLIKAGKINIPVIYIDSMLHMKPKELQQILDKKIKEHTDCKIILAFGDCHARMIDYEKNKNIVRTQGINCGEIFMGSANYKKVRKEGAFILLPEWTDRWKEVFVDELGFKSAKQIQPFMKEMHSSLLYIDTGLQKINHELLSEISDYMGLPVKIYPASLKELEIALEKLMNPNN